MPGSSSSMLSGRNGDGRLEHTGKNRGSLYLNLVHNNSSKENTGESSRKA